MQAASEPKLSNVTTLLQALNLSESTEGLSRDEIHSLLDEVLTKTEVSKTLYECRARKLVTRYRPDGSDPLYSITPLGRETAIKNASKPAVVAVPATPSLADEIVNKIRDLEKAGHREPIAELEKKLAVLSELAQILHPETGAILTTIAADLKS